MLLPKEDKFFEMFNQQVEIILRAADNLKEITEKLPQINFIEKLQEINHLEHMGDDLVHEIAVMLNKTFVTSIDREDIHQLAMYLDDILDYIQGAANRIQLYKIEKSTAELNELTNVTARSCYLVKKGVEFLPKFKPEISDLRKEMKILEREADTIHRSALAHLFNSVDIAILDVIKWKDIYGTLESAVDKCEDAFDIMEGVALKHA